MTRRPIRLSDRQVSVIETLVGSGRFANAEAVVDEGLRLVASRNLTDDERRDALCAAIKVGLDDLDNRRFYEFETGEQLEAHLDELLAEVVASDKTT